MANRLSKIVKPGKKQKPVPVKIVSDAPSPAVNRTDEDIKWKAQDALRTLQRADEIRRDKGLLKAAKAEAKSQIKQLSGVCK